MIAVKEGRWFEYRDIIKRSPVAEIPEAEEILKTCVRRSADIWCGMLDDEVACVWGTIPATLISERAYLWLLTTEIVVEHKFLFVRHSQICVEKALGKYKELYGDVMVGNPSAKRWLRWLGATFGESDGKKIPFVIRRK